MIGRALLLTAVEGCCYRKGRPVMQKTRHLLGAAIASAVLINPAFASDVSSSATFALLGAPAIVLGTDRGGIPPGANRDSGTILSTDRGGIPPGTNRESATVLSTDRGGIPPGTNGDAGFIHRVLALFFGTGNR